MNLIIQGLNILLIVGIIFNAYRCSKAGFLNNAISLFSIIIGFLLTPLLTTLIKAFLMNYTGVYDFFLSYGEKLINAGIGGVNLQVAEAIQPFTQSAVAVTSNTFAVFIIRIISFAISIIIAKILFKALFSVSNVGTSIINQFSVTSMFNRVLGLIYGLVLQCVIWWTTLYILTLLSYFSFVNTILIWILKIPICSWLHTHNPLISLF